MCYANAKRPMAAKTADNSMSLVPALEAAPVNCDGAGPVDVGTGATEPDPEPPAATPWIGELLPGPGVGVASTGAGTPAAKAVELWPLEMYT